jgi:hypothetical protein
MLKKSSSYLLRLNISGEKLPGLLSLAIFTAGFIIKNYE